MHEDIHGILQPRHCDTLTYHNATRHAKRPLYQRELRRRYKPLVKISLHEKLNKLTITSPPAIVPICDNTYIRHAKKNCTTTDIIAAITTKQNQAEHVVVSSLALPKL